MGTAGLARFLVSGYRRVPAPPPRITAARGGEGRRAREALQGRLLLAPCRPMQQAAANPSPPANARPPAAAWRSHP